MAILTEADLVNAIGRDMVMRLLDDDMDGLIDADVLSAICDDGEGEVHGYVGRVYSVETLTADPPATLRRLMVDCALQLAYLRRPEFLNDRGETPWEGRYKRALQKLKEIRDGDFRLDVDSAPQKPANVRGGGVRTGTYGNTVTIGEGFIKDGTGSGGF